MDMEAFYIPRTLDEPARLLFWSIDEAGILLSPTFLGIILGYAAIGMLVGFIAFFAWKRVKGSNKANYIMYSAYWYLPSKMLRLKKTPPSHFRIFLG